MFEQLVQWVTHDKAPWIMAGTIFALALLPLYWALFSIRTVNTQLKKARDTILEEAPTGDHKQFHLKFDHINNRLNEFSILKTVWREFVESTFASAHEGGQPQRYLSHRPSHYFHRDAILGQKINISQFLACPNYLIGLGLTFTFIGLAAALHVAQAGLATVSGGQEALKQLLAVASVKFISSIAGVCYGSHIPCLAITGHFFSCIITYT